VIGQKSSFKLADLFDQLQTVTNAIDFSFASENRLKAHEKLGHDENGKALDYGQGGRGNAIKGPKPFQRSSINQKLYNSKDIIEH